MKSFKERPPLLIGWLLLHLAATLLAPPAHLALGWLIAGTCSAVCGGVLCLAGEEWIAARADWRRRAARDLSVG